MSNVRPFEMALNLHKQGSPIASLDSWFQLAPPKKGKAQWVDLRSAKELARAFLHSGIPSVPDELQALFSSHSCLGNVVVSEATPEEKITLDEFPGETRNADLTAVADCALGPLGITVEAKADESFGNSLASRLSQVKGKNSNLPKRLNQLTLAVCGASPEALPTLRYQLVHGAAASLIFAGDRGAQAAIFAVFEFHSPACSPNELRRNAKDFDKFMVSLGGIPAVTGVLQGPFSVPGGGRVPSDIPLFVGKAIREL